MIERIPDPLDEAEWNPRPGTLRITYDTKELMRRAGIVSDMSEAAEERYLEYLSGLSRELPGEVGIRSTGYRYGPAAGDADLAFIDLVLRGVDLAQAAYVLTTALNWLRKAGALEIRISDEAAEKLGQWELERAGMTGAQLLSQQLVRAQRGSAAKYDGYVLVFRLPDSRLATVSLSIDGILQQLVGGGQQAAVRAIEGSDTDRRTANGPTREADTEAMARTGDTRLFSSKPLPTGALATLGRRLAGLYGGNVRFELTRTTEATEDEVGSLTELASQQTKVHIALDTPRTPTIGIEGTADTLVVSVTITGSGQADLLYALVRETLRLGEAKRLTGPGPEADI